MGNLVDERQDDMKTQKGIGLYKIRYEMDVKSSSKEQSYVAGVVAYTSKEAIDTLVKFATKRVKGFKGMKVDEVSFDGACHAISDTVKDAILKTAINEGDVVSREMYEMALESIKNVNKQPKPVKKSVIPTKE